MSHAFARELLTGHQCCDVLYFGSTNWFLRFPHVTNDNGKTNEIELNRKIQTQSLYLETSGEHTKETKQFSNVELDLMTEDKIRIYITTMTVVKRLFINAIQHDKIYLFYKSNFKLTTKLVHTLVPNLDYNTQYK